MKGVTGVTNFPPGVTDLFGLWNSTKTINENQPGANSLTPNFPGHYKPDLSNNWPSLCLDKVRRIVGRIRNIDIKRESVDINKVWNILVSNIQLTKS